MTTNKQNPWKELKEWLFNTPEDLDPPDNITNIFSNYYIIQLLSNHGKSTILWNNLFNNYGLSKIDKIHLLTYLKEYIHKEGIHRLAFVKKQKNVKTNIKKYYPSIKTHEIELMDSILKEVDEFKDLQS